MMHFFEGGGGGKPVMNNSETSVSTLNGLLDNQKLNYLIVHFTFS